MPTFIDESGCTAYEEHSKPYFRLAAVHVPTFDAAEAFRADVRQLRKQLGVSASFEFKYHTTTDPKRRAAFFSTAMRHEFRFAVAGIDKRIPGWWGVPPADIHHAVAESVAVDLRPTYLKAAEAHDDRKLGELVIVDDNQDAAFLAAIKAAFGPLGRMAVPPAKLIGKVKFRGSGPDELLQLADMLCGAAGEHMEGWGECYELVAERCVGLRVLP